MKPSDLIVLSLNSRLVALDKGTGEIRWAAQLPGKFGDGFVTVASDGTQVYAFAKGQIHCLDLSTGRILWTNELKGYGYGIASLCIPGLASAPESAAYAQVNTAKRSAASAD